MEKSPIRGLSCHYWAVVLVSAMALVVYRPEQENPPREASVAFMVNSQSVTLNPGVNRGFSDTVLEEIRKHPLMERLVKIGAVEVMDETEDVEAIPADTDIGALSYSAACAVIDRCHDVTQLQEWQSQDQRIRVRNAIARRLQQIQEGTA